MVQEDKNGIIYLEVDEDITSAVDKLSQSTASKVQMVTAKRSTLFQSVINLKLLKKAAADSSKQLVLVTSDRVANNLAGRIGVPVASQVGEAARVPTVQALGLAAAEDEIDGGTVGGTRPPTDELTPADIVKPPEAKPEPTVMSPSSAAVTAGAAAAKAAKRRSPVPNIGGMQKRLIWVAAGLALIGGLFALNYYLTSASVVLHVKGTQHNASFNFTADPNASQTDPAAGILSATQVSTTKTVNGSVTATGTKDEGAKAKGSITVSNCYDNNTHALVAGTRFVSPDGKVFRSDNDVDVPGGSGSFFGCTTPGKVTVSVTADQNGDQYNLGPAKYNIPGLPDNEQAGSNSISAAGGQMQGGITKTAKIITQADVDNAKTAALNSGKTGAQQDLSHKAGSGQVVLDASYQQSVGKVTPSPDVGIEAQTGSVAVEVTYSELSVKQSELSELAKAQEQDQVGPDQQIYDDGSGNLQLAPVGSPDSNGAEKFSAKAKAFSGTKVDTAQLVSQIKGKKYGEAMDTASKLPDVDKVDISLTPSWATSLPSIDKHIKVQVTVDNQ